MTKRSNSIAPRHLIILWGASLGLYGLARLGLSAAYGFSMVGPGLLALVAMLMAASWALVEEPLLAPSGAWQLMALWSGLALLVGGEACLYYYVEGKDRVAPLGFALLAGGVLCLLRPAGRSALVLRLTVLVSAILLAWLGWRACYGTLPMDLVAGPLQGDWGPKLAWALLSIIAACLLALAHQHQPSTPSSSALSWRTELWLLLAVLALGAAIRFPRLGAVPDGIWYDEMNLSRVTEARVLNTGEAPLYVGEQVENAGAYLWVGAAVYKAVGASVLPYRYLAACFGLLALVPFWGLARLWFGPRWALAATALFAVLRWTLIPQRIAFMSGFALFWMLAAMWSFWSARLRGGAWRWLLAGAALGCNLHTYTPGRLVPLVVTAFIVLELLFEPKQRRQLLTGTALMLAGFAVTGGPMCWYIATHWDAYALRSAQVSIFTDAAKSGQALSAELWTSLTKHLLMFNLRGDFNARHNLHFYPHVDLLTAAGLALGLPYALGRFFKDARSRFLGLWFAAMLCAGIFTLAVEAPQGHRTILAAPVLALAVMWAARDLVAPYGKAFSVGWPRAGVALGIAVLLSVAAFNAYEVFGVWGPNSETWRSFSPFATAAARRIAASPEDEDVRLSQLRHEYQFHGYEWTLFTQYFLRRQARQVQTLEMGTLLNRENSPPRGVLLVWGESDEEITQAFARQFPDITVEKPVNPYPVAGEPSVLYLAAELPWQRIPYLKDAGKAYLIARQPPLIFSKRP